MSKWYLWSMILNETNFIRLERDRFKNHSKVKVFVYKCSEKQCDREIRIQQSYLNFHKGKCRSCTQRGNPYEATFNELKKSAKRRGLKVTLLYEDFINFTKIKNCYYCNDKIKWNKYTRENGKILSRSYNLDRRNNNIGYELENCVVCCFKCNEFKTSYNEYEFIDLCRKIAENNAL